MTIKTLLQLLAEFPLDTVVTVYNPEVQKTIPITGYLYDPEKLEVELHSDDPN